jgi:hypothetical protein
MVMEYQKSRIETCAALAYKAGVEARGVDGVSQDPHERGLEAVVDLVTDYALSAVLNGLGIDAKSAEAMRIMGAYVDGIQRLDPAEFASAMNRGQTRKIR